MIISTLLFAGCFLIIATRKEERARVVAAVCLAYLALENIILHLSLIGKIPDITLHLSILWVMDFVLLFLLGVISKGIRQVSIVSMGLPLVIVQVFSLQYPEYLPANLYVFSVQSAHLYFVEILVFIYAWKEGSTVAEWFRTGTVLSLLLLIHLIR